MEKGCKKMVHVRRSKYTFQLVLCYSMTTISTYMCNIHSYEMKVR